ncbi:MAG: Fe-S cluster assembly protein SufD [Chloroflexota bacterium]
MSTLTLDAPADTLRTGLTEAASRALSESREDPDWVAPLRGQGWDAWQTIPMPSRSMEGWRRANLRFLDLDNVQASAPASDRFESLKELPAALLEQMQTDFEQAGLLVQRNGYTAYGSLLNAVLDQGVVFTDLHTALRDHRELIEPYFMKLVPPRWQPGEPTNAGKFEALNAAFFGGGAFVYVPPDVSVALPLRAVHWAEDTRAGFFPRTVVIADRNAKLVFLDEYRSETAAEGIGFGSGVVEMYAADGARIDYVTIQEWAPNTAGFLTQRVDLGQDAFINLVHVGLGAMFSRVTAEVLMRGKGSGTDILGLVFGDKNQVFDVHTYQDHLAPFTASDQLFKTAMSDRARLDYEGMIDIHAGSYGSTGYQANKNLLLDDTAQAGSLPMLKINDNDVRCTHSSSVGPIDETHVHYLMTRGLDRPTAERMLIHGFFAPVIDRAAVEELKDWIRERVDRKIGDR